LTRIFRKSYADPGYGGLSRERSNRVLDESKNVRRYQLCSSVWLSAESVAKADQVYSWQGTCVLGCSGTATGVLTLTDGAAPFAFTAANFISFEFTSSSGTFFLDNTSPYLNAVGAACSPGNCSNVALEENAFGPNTLPLWQFVFSTTALPNVTLSSEPGGWQFLSGSYFWECLNPNCTEWTDNVIRNVGVDGFFTTVAPVPAPIAGVGLPGMVSVLMGGGLVAWWRRRQKTA
jgi:hypothetical protein